MVNMSTRHPYLDRIVQAEADRLSEKWGRSGVEPREGVTLVFGLADDVQMDMVRVSDDGQVRRAKARAV
jgi:hypothetical protein